MFRTVTCSEESGFAPDPREANPAAGSGCGPDGPASIEFLRSILDTIGDPVFVKDEQHRLVLVNDAECELTGLPRGQLLGRTEHHLDPGQLQAFWAQDDRVLATGEDLVVEDELVHPVHGRRVLQTRKSRLVLPTGERFVVGVIRDVTGARQVEQMKRKMAAAVEQSPNGIVIMDARGRVEFVNSAFTRNTGYGGPEVEGRTMQELLNPGGDPARERSLWETVRAGRTWSGRVANIARDGHTMTVDTVFSSIVDASGAIVGYVVAGRDVTQQVAIEERAAQAGKLEAIGTLAGGVAHDFNNLLSAIVGYTQLARAKCATGTPEWRALGSVLQASQRAVDLVRQILAFSRRGDQEATPVQVAPIVDEALGLLRASVPAEVEIRRDLRSSALVLADPGGLYRALVNLGTNAALAMRERGGLLEVTLDDVDLDADAATPQGLHPGPHVRLRVRDTGCGMSREVAARAFEPFFTTRRPGEGTGMGLAVVHGIVHRARGAISVASEPGRGATFEVLLPQAAPGDCHVPRQPQALPRGRERIVLVDDDAMVLDSTAEALRELGYAVRPHDRPAEALAEIEAAPGSVDLLLTDSSMPRMSGEELIGRVRRVRADLPVILFSGCCDGNPAERARSLGIEAFVMKPLRMEDLARLLRDVLEREERRAA